MAHTYNYYKLLGIPNGSGIVEAEQAYVRLCAQIQNASETKTELLNILNEGLALLRNPKLKAEYDTIILKMELKIQDPKFSDDMYRKYGKSARNPTAVDVPMLPKNLENRNDQIEVKEMRKLEWIFLYFLVLAYLIVPFIIENRYWEPYNQSKIMFYAALFFVHLPIVAVMTRWAYLISIVKFKSTVKRGLARSTIFFFLMFIGYPLFIIRALKVEKYFYLRNSNYTTINKIEVDYLNNVYYYYKVNGKQYVQSEEAPILIRQSETELYKPMKVKYSTSAPEISEIANWKEIEKYRDSLNKSQK